MASTLPCLALFSVLLGLSYASTLFHSPKSEAALRKYLFEHYDKLVRPVKDADDPISTAVSLTPIYIRELDEKNQVLVLESWMMLKWTDEYLKWDPRRFGNVTVLRIPSTEVWRPDFAIYGAPDASALFPSPVTNALVYNTGTVLWVPLFTIRSHCPMLKPSKKLVTCNIKVGSWTFSEPLLDIQLGTEKVDLSNFLDTNVNWKLMDVSSERVSKHYPCCVEAYPNLNFNVTLKRRHVESNEIRSEPESQAKLEDVVFTDFTDIEKFLGR